MVIFKKRAEKERLLIEKLEKECDEKNLVEQWIPGTGARNRHKLYKDVWIVNYKSSQSWTPPPYGWAIRRDVWAVDTEKCSITDLLCRYDGDCRTCVEPIMSKLVIFK
jgi:hypothetical protein